MAVGVCVRVQHVCGTGLSSHSPGGTVVFEFGASLDGRAGVRFDLKTALLTNLIRGLHSNVGWVGGGAEPPVGVPSLCMKSWLIILRTL